MPLALGLLTVFTPLAVIGIGAWILNHPWRPSVRFKALHDELAACRDSIGPIAPTDEEGLRAVVRVGELQQKLKRLGVRLRLYDPYDDAERQKCWSTLTVLAGYAVVGDIKAARSMRER